MTFRTIPAVLGLVLLLLPAALAAQTYEFAIAGNESTTGDPERASERGAAVNFDFEAEVKLGLLLDEPVISMRMRYELVGGVVTTPTFEPGEDRYETRQLDLLPVEAAERLRLHDAKIRFTFDSGTGDGVELIVDAGHLKLGGAWSFNVPGSPDWDGLFIVPGSIFSDGEPSFYTEDSARAIWASGLTLSAWEIMDIRLSQYDMHRWYAENNERDRFRVLSRATEQVEKGIAASYGYQFRGDDADPLLDGMSSVVTWLDVEADTGGFDGRVEYDKAQWQRVVRRAEERLLKLTSLPPDLVIGDNHEPYRASVQNARRLLQLTDRNIRSFEPDGVDVASLPQGFEAEFDRSSDSLAILWIDSSAGLSEFFVYDPASDTIADEFPGQYAMLVGRYFLRNEEERCRGDDHLYLGYYGPSPGYEWERRRINEDISCTGYYVWRAGDPENGEGSSRGWVKFDDTTAEILDTKASNSAQEAFNDQHTGSGHIWVGSAQQIYQFPEENGLVLCMNSFSGRGCERAYFFDLDLNLVQEVDNT
jgi:hypothetical protein